MEEKKENIYSLTELIAITKSFLNYMLKRWWILIISLLIGAALGTIYYYSQKPKYIAETTFILEEKTNDGAGLSNLASQFGFNIGGMGSGGMFSGDNILDILKSKKIIHKVLLSNVSDLGSNHQTMADFYLDFTGTRKRWQKKPLLASINFTDASIKPLSPIQDSVLNSLYRAIVKKNLFVDRLNKKSSIIKLEVTSVNDVFAKLLSMRLVEEASRLYTDIRTGNLQENISQLQRRSDSLLLLLNRKSFVVASEQPLDINPAIRTAIVPSEIANRDKTVLATLYAEVTKNLEASKMLLNQQMPVIQVLDKPEELPVENKKGFYFLIGIGSFITAAICMAALFFCFMLSGMIGAQTNVTQVEKSAGENLRTRF